jgi:hypothetical protein
MAQTKARKSERTTRRATRGKAANKGQASQGRTKKVPTKAALKQMAKDWDHVT